MVEKSKEANLIALDAAAQAKARRARSLRILERIAEALSVPVDTFFQPTETPAIKSKG